MRDYGGSGRGGANENSETSAVSIVLDIHRLGILLGIFAERNGELLAFLPCIEFNFIYLTPPRMATLHDGSILFPSQPPLHLHHYPQT